MRHRIIIALAALALAGQASAEPLARIYKGTTAKDANIVLGGWGSGGAKETKEEAFSGTYSIFVASDGYYSGGRIDFTSPVDLSRFASEKSAALGLHVKFASASSTGGETPGGGFFQGPIPGMGPIPGPGRSGIPGVPGIPGMAPGVADVPVEPAVTSMRFVIYGGGAAYAAAQVPVDTVGAENGWVNVQVPLRSFTASADKTIPLEGMKMERLLVFGDVSDDFYIGDIEVVKYAGAITDVDAGEGQTVAVNEMVPFAATANGPPGLEYAWDFDKEDGIQKEVYGKTANYRFRRSGTYTVTVTVTDTAGVAKPVTDTVEIEVTE